MSLDRLGMALGITHTMNMNIGKAGEIPRKRSCPDLNRYKEHVHALRGSWRIGGRMAVSPLTDTQI